MAPPEQRRQAALQEARPEVPQAFEAIWTTLVDILGAPTATTVVRRSARRASVTHPTLAGLTIRRGVLDYEFDVPASWRESQSDSTADIAALAAEVRIVLEELTGVLVIRTLNEHPTLKALGWFCPEDR